MSKSTLTRRGVLKSGAVAGAGLAMPTYLAAGSHAGYTNAPAWQHCDAWFQRILGPRVWLWLCKRSAKKLA